MEARYLYFIFVWIVNANVMNAQANVTSAEIMGNSLSVSCIDWKLTGVCFWLKCNALPPSCSINESIKVRHFNPDAIVQVYQEPGEVPWEEMSFVSDLVSFDQSGATPTDAGSMKKSGKYKKQNTKIINRHVDVIGSPGLIPVSEFLGSMDYFCESGVTMYMPYFVSTLDYYSWKFPYVDFLKAGTWVPGMNEVGERKDGENKNLLLSGKFGNVYPRIGSLIQNDTYKASAVFAQRAADIVTDSGAMHIYSFLGEQKSKKGWWPPKKVEEWTSKEGKWQMLYPKMESSCHIFGAKSTRDNSVIEDGYGPRRSDDGNYAWQLWRPYECCEKKGQVFLFKVDIAE